MYENMPIEESPNMSRRIRTPYRTDVLSGRGGSINSHDGNRQFREWVRERKDAYNLAGSKVEKARVANEVIDLVKNQMPPGRFLQRESASVSGASYWVEVDEVRALAKTSQALREGAPQIRAAHKSEIEERIKRTKRRKPSRSGAKVSKDHNIASYPVATKTVPSKESSWYSRAEGTHSEPDETLKLRVVQTSDADDQLPTRSGANNSELDRPSKRAKNAGMEIGNSEGVSVDAYAETPPLTSAPPPLVEIPSLSLQTDSKQNLPRKAYSSGELLRANSLALTDFSSGDVPDEELGNDFVNPFADESDVSVVDVPTPKSPRVLRNVGTDESHVFGGEPNLQSRNLRATRRKSNKAGSNSRPPQEISDVPDTVYQRAYETFGESMLNVLDAVNPDLTSPEKDDGIPTLLMPWRGGASYRRSSSFATRTFSLGGQGERQ